MGESNQEIYMHKSMQVQGGEGQGDKTTTTTKGTFVELSAIKMNLKNFKQKSYMQ